MTFVEIETRGGTFVSGLHISLGTLYSPIEPPVTSFFLNSTLSLPPPLTNEAINPHKNCRQNYNFMLLPPLKEHEKPPSSEMARYSLMFRESLMFLASG